MCYDLQYLTRDKYRYASRYGASPEEVEELKEQLNKIDEHRKVFHASGFDHPDLMVITDDNPGVFQFLNWGLIPYWVKDAASAVRLSHQTLNARGEEMFDKPSFKDAAMSRRCLVILDGFFEHHHKNGKTFPYYIKLKNDEPITVAGLWSRWKDRSSGLVKKTVSIVTTKANPMMARIHNNPKAEEGPRMPVMLPRELEKQWLIPIHDKPDREIIESLITPYDEDEMEAYTVRRIRGKEAVGNNPLAQERHVYPELVETPGLFS